MAETSGISWTDATFNPWIGCTKVSAGCANCYAEADFDKRKGFAKWGDRGTRVVKAEAGWREPLKWDREAAKAGARKRVFCASLADVFEAWQGPMSVADGRILVRPYLDAENQPKNWQMEDPETFACDPQGWRPVRMGDVRLRVFDLIRQTPNLDWLLLTKRPENITRWIADAMNIAWGVPQKESPLAQWMEDWLTQHAVPKNVWLGTSVEHQAAADARVPHLLAAPAVVRFLSCEPLLGPVDLMRIRIPLHGESFMTRSVLHATDGLNKGAETPGRDKRVDWVIVGGESGPGARSMHIAWSRSLVEQCKDAGVACFVKQMGSAPVWGQPSELLTLNDKKGGDPAEWPANLHVREFPRTEAA